MSIKRGPNWKDESVVGSNKRIYTSRPDLNYQPDPVNDPANWEECVPEFTNQSDRWECTKVRLPIEISKVTGNGIKLNIPGSGNVFIKPKNFNIPTPTVETRKITLENLWQNTDLEIIASTSGLKTWYVLNDVTSPTSFEWEITTTGAYDLQNKADGTIGLYEDNNLLLSFKVPYIINSSGSISTGSLSTSKQGSKWTLTVNMPDITGLDFPIRIDPTISYPISVSTDDGTIRYPQTNTSWDSHISESFSVGSWLFEWPAVQLGTSTIYSGEYILLGRGAVNFDMSGFSEGATIVSASLKGYVNSANTTHTNATHNVHVCDFYGDAVSHLYIAYTYWGGVSHGSASFSSVTTGSLVSIPLNDTGKSKLVPTSSVWFGLRQHNDMLNSEPTHILGKQSEVQFATLGDPSYDPMTLEIEYTLSSGGGAGASAPIAMAPKVRFAPPISNVITLSGSATYNATGSNFGISGLSTTNSNGTVYLSDGGEIPLSSLSNGIFYPFSVSKVILNSGSCSLRRGR